MPRRGVVDPNENLRAQEKILERGQPYSNHDTWRLRALRLALDKWLNDQKPEPEWDRFPLAARRFGK